MKKEVNYTPKNIKEFKPGDTIYLTKNDHGYAVHFFCEFITFYRNIVRAKILKTEPDWALHWVGKITTVQLRKCYLWGNTNNDKNITWDHCIWFHGDGFAK